MKSTVFAVASFLACASFAAQNDALVTFSTPGPDTYADGTEVLPGECYALVWTSKGANFEILADGTVSAGCEIVLVAPVAEGGHCPRIVFQVPAAKVDGYKNGTWSVYLLDTRRIGKDGVKRPAGVKADGSAWLVNAAGQVAGSSVSLASGTVSSFSGSGTSCATMATEVPEDAPTPEIKSINIIGGNVYVTVANTVPYLTYDLTEGATPDAVTKRVNDPRTGEDDGTVVLVAPVKDGGAFFRVDRN